jgi:hypothetical protein
MLFVKFTYTWNDYFLAECAQITTASLISEVKGMNTLTVTLSSVHHITGFSLDPYSPNTVKVSVQKFVGGAFVALDSDLVVCSQC